MSPFLGGVLGALVGVAFGYLYVRFKSQYMTVRIDATVPLSKDGDDD